MTESLEHRSEESCVRAVCRLHSSRGCDDDLRLWSAGLRAVRFNGLYHVHAFYDFAKDDVLVVQP